MVYQGSKNKLAKYLKPIIEEFLQNKKIYIEPFVGGANLIDKIEWAEKIGADNNKYLIALHKRAQQMPLPTDKVHTREAYNHMRDIYNKGLSGLGVEDWEIGYYGFLMSYNGRFFDGGYGVFDKSGRNLFLSRLNNLNKQRESLNYQNIKFIHCDFMSCIVEDAVIYLDPPYQNVKQYGKAFDHSRLWDYVRQMGQPGKNNIILLSELTNPNENEWVEIWNQEYSYSLRDRNNKNKKVIEKLFMWVGKYD